MIERLGIKRMGCEALKSRSTCNKSIKVCTMGVNDTLGALYAVRQSQQDHVSEPSSAPQRYRRWVRYLKLTR